MPTRVLQRSVGLEIAYSGDQLQPCAHGPLCIVLVGLGIAEINQDPVAHVLRHKAAEALHGLCDALLVGRNDLAEVFRVPRYEVRSPHQKPTKSGISRD